MCLGSLTIACTPGYAAIGHWAPALLLFARLLQGFSIGGEYGSSATYLSEMATPDRRGYFSSFQYVTIVLGQLLALTLLMALQKWFLTGEELHQWGWRIPFIFGGMLSVVALGLRGRMAETNAFVEQHAYIKGQATLADLRKHPKAVMTVVALTAGGTVSYYTLTVYMQKFLVNTTGLSKDDATLICLFALFLFMLAQPVFGLISDRVGRRFMLIGFGLGASIFTVPIFSLLSQPQSFLSALGFYCFALLILSGYSSVNAIVKAELFPVHIRALGVGFPYALTVSIFGGTAEYLALWLKSIGHAEWYAYYVSACAALSLIVSIMMKEPSKVSSLDR